MKTLQQIIENYAHDYRDLAMNEENLRAMIWDFWREQEKVSKIEHLNQFMSKINSVSFSDWYFNN